MMKWKQFLVGFKEFLNRGFNPFHEYEKGEKMSDYAVVDLDEEDVLCHTRIDYQRGILRLTQISDVAPRTIKKFKDAGWTVEEGVLLERGVLIGKDGKPVPVEPPTHPLQSSNQTTKRDE